MGANIGWLFYKNYYDATDLSIVDYKAKTEGITRKKLVHYNIPDYKNVTDIPPLILRTTYPGLLLGSGYQHTAKDDNAFKLGFYFDYSTGLPVIPGSSIKGALRSVFPFHNKDFGESFQESRIEYIKDLLQDIGINTDAIDKEKIKELEFEIFEKGVVQEKTDSKEEIIKHDLFFDAYPIKSYEHGGRLLAEDYITPHKDPLKNPKPIKFLKILPEVEFYFYFKLNDSNVITDLTKEKKLELFKTIILDMGLGAKTNVGYGQFEFKAELLSENITNQHIEFLSVNMNDIYDAVVKNINEEYILFELKRNGLEDCLISKRKSTIIIKFKKDLKRKLKKNDNAQYKDLEIGDDVKIRINKIENSGINFTVLPIWVQ